MSEHILYRTELRSSGLLRSEQCELSTDVSKQSFSPSRVFLTLSGSSFPTFQHKLSLTTSSNFGT